MLNFDTAESVHERGRIMTLSVFEREFIKAVSTLEQGWAAPFQLGDVLERSGLTEGELLRAVTDLQERGWLLCFAFHPGINDVATLSADGRRHAEELAETLRQAKKTG